ncbi:MAG: Gfo/Idh/MocA family oxidoreductase [Pirellulaceae bacterium]|nr:Gfo/Idh/MocA family oxidoreductase [Pirellulaceae bacterium]
MKNQPTSRSNRRQWLWHTAVLGGGCFVAESLPAKDSNSSLEKLHIACIGAGGKGETNILGVMREQVVAVCDVDQSRGQKGFKLVPRAKRYVDYREMLDDLKDIDCVVVSTPDHSHGPAAIRSLRMGYHVYCEKPLAHSIYEARLMKQIAEEKNLVTQMGNQGHASPVLREAVEIIRSGAIGKVTEFHAWTNRPSWPQGLSKPTEQPPIPADLNWDLWLGRAAYRDYHPAYCPFNWRGWWDFGTGALGDMACHIVDMGFWALDLKYPDLVVADATGQSPDSPPRSSTVQFQFPARGDQPPVKFTWYDGGRKPDPKLVGQSQLASGGSILVGDQGSMYLPGDYGNKYQLFPADKFADYKPPAPSLPRVTTASNDILVAASHYREWLDGCKGGAQPQSNFTYAALLTEVVLLGNLAIRAGKPIKWDPVKMRAIGVPEADAWIQPDFRSGWQV